METKDQEATVQSVGRAIAILRAFDSHQPELGVTELSGKLGLNKTTVYRLLTSLQRGGLVDQNPETGKYRLGIGLVSLAGLVLEHIDVRQVARPYLRALAEKTEETVTLSVLANGEVVNIERVPSPRMVTNVGWVGRRMLPHCVSSGKALLAYLPEHEVESILARGLPRFTDKTITDPARLREELKKVRLQGYAVAQEELEEGLNAVAAPIRNHEGEAIAAVSVSGPSFRLSPEKIPRLAKLTKQTADEISRHLGYVAGEASHEGGILP